MGTQKTFSIGAEPRVRLSKIQGNLEVSGWDRREIRLSWDGDERAIQQEGTTLALPYSSGNVEMHVPYDTEIIAEGQLSGNAELNHLRRVELHGVRGNVELEDIGDGTDFTQQSEAILLAEGVGGNVEVNHSPSLRVRGKVRGNVDIDDVQLVEIEAIDGDCDVEDVALFSLGSVSGDLEVENVSEGVRCGNVGGDCQIEGKDHPEVHFGNIGGDLDVEDAALVQIGNIGGDCDISKVLGSVHLGNVGSDLLLEGVGGDVTVGMIGSDARLFDLAGGLRLGVVGGDLDLRGEFPPESQTHIQVGGDALVTLPAEANLALQASVGGSLSCPSLSTNGSGHLVRLVYGQGQAQAQISVGGDLSLRGGGQPQVSSASMPWGDFGREMAHMGQQIAHEFLDSFSSQDWNMNWNVGDWTDDVSRRVEEQLRKARRKAEHSARKAEENVRKAEERARKEGDKARREADRFFVRVNEREWQMNPDRLNDLLNRAHQATMEGVAGAMDAVERAVSNLRVAPPPVPPSSRGRTFPSMPPTGPNVPPVPPVPPMPPTGQSVPPVPPMPPTDQPAAWNEGSNSPDPASAEEAADRVAGIEQEREAILRMIAEGRITPEEGDMLLEGLGN